MTYELSVDRSHLERALCIFGKQLRKVKASERAILGFDGKYLTIECRHVVAHAQGSGTWPGNAYVSASLINALAVSPFARDRVTVSCDGVNLQFGPVKLGCRWQPVSSQLQDLPGVQDWMRGLAISYLMPRGQVVADGLAREVEEAEQKLAALVNRAAKTLAPLGISVADVEALVVRRLEERYVRRSDESGGPANN